MCVGGRLTDPNANNAGDGGRHRLHVVGRLTDPDANNVGEGGRHGTCVFASRRGGRLAGAACGPMTRGLTVRGGRRAFGGRHVLSRWVAHRPRNEQDPQGKGTHARPRALQHVRITDATASAHAQHIHGSACSHGLAFWAAEQGQANPSCGQHPSLQATLARGSSSVTSHMPRTSSVAEVMSTVRNGSLDTLTCGPNTGTAAVCGRACMRVRGRRRQVACIKGMSKLVRTGMRAPQTNLT